jgi:hypothetical protein
LSFEIVHERGSYRSHKGEWQYRNYRLGEVIKEPPESLDLSTHAKRIARNLGIPIYPDLRMHTAGLLEKAARAERGSKGNRSDSEGKWESYESIVSMKLGHQN